MEKIIKIKIITLGASDVGKTSIINRIVSKKFSEQMVSTTGIDKNIIERDYKTKNLKMLLEFTDTAGQEQYCDLPKQYIRGCHIVLLVFCDLGSLEELKNRWFRLYKDNANLEKSKFIVVINKSDTFGEKRDEINNSGELFAEEINNSFFISCSAKNEDNIDNLENHILKEAKDIINKEEEEEKKGGGRMSRISTKSQRIVCEENITVNKNNVQVQIKTGTCC